MTFLPSLFCLITHFSNFHQHLVTSFCCYLSYLSLAYSKAVIFIISTHSNKSIRFESISISKVTGISKIPPKRKVARSNKKKKGGQATKNTGKENAASSSGPLLPKNLTDNSSARPKDEDVGAHYQRYKQSNQAVRIGLRDLLPESFPLASVNDLARAANHLLDASLDFNKFISTCIEKSAHEDDEDGRLKNLDD